MKANRWESFLTSWKFFSLLVVLQFILMPVATKGFKFEAAGDIVFYTLQHAFIMDMYSYSFYFQVVIHRHPQSHPTRSSFYLWQQ